MKGDVSSLLQKYPDKIPIILNSHKNSIKLDKTKYLVNKDYTISHFLTIIRKHIDIKSSQAIFILCKGILPCSTITLEDAYKQYKNEDNILLFDVCLENTFG
tara:strand:- start:406 stop:711 length:306 start_codon:yes stop_codon:yes gene_type:complete